MTDVWILLGVQDPMRGRFDSGGYDNMWFDFAEVKRRWIEISGFDPLDPPAGTPEHELVFVQMLSADVEQRKRISAALEQEVREGLVTPLYAERAVPWTIVSGEYVESAAASRKAACWVDPNPHNRTYEPWWTDAEWHDGGQYMPAIQLLCARPTVLPHRGPR